MDVAAAHRQGGTARPHDVCLNYPTLAECYKVAALDASNKLRF